MSLPASRHVFISYSRADSDFAARLIRDLEARGIGVWVDVEGLQPGTPNWEKSIREAIRQAFAIVFIASPDSAQSGPVHGELGISQAANKVILPVWAAGDHWASCAPFDLMRAQYIDLRDNQYDANFVQLIAAIEQQRPDHMVIEQEDALPHGYFKVGMGDFGNQSTIAFKYTAFSSAREFSDVLYTTYLRDTVAPFTYGSQWILASDAGLDQPWLGVRRLCVPFSWFLLPEEQRKQPMVAIDAHWGDTSLASFGVKSDTNWQVMRLPTTIFGIVTNEDFFASIFDSLTDVHYGKLIADILIAPLQERSETHSAYQHRFVCTYDGRQPKPHLSGKVLVPIMQDYYRDVIPDRR
jgi:TIR domain